MTPFFYNLIPISEYSKVKSVTEDDPEDGEVADDGADDHDAEDDRPRDVRRPGHVVERLVTALLVKLPVCSSNSMGSHGDTNYTAVVEGVKMNLHYISANNFILI